MNTFDLRTFESGNNGTATTLCLTCTAPLSNDHAIAQQLTNCELECGVISQQSDVTAVSCVLLVFHLGLEADVLLY